MRALEQSLRRLGTDYVDLLWLHMRDDLTPIEEAVRALDDQVRLGKVLHVGISDSPAWVAAQANTLADLRGWSPFVALQIPYSAASRDPERELLPMAAALGLAVVPWGVLGAGMLTGSRRRSAAGRRTASRSAPSESWRLCAKWRRRTSARRPRSRSPGLASGRRRRRSSRSSRRRARSRSSRTSPRRTITLEPAEIDAIDEAGKPQLGFPRDFLESTDVRELIYGDTYDRIRRREASLIRG